MSHAAQIARHYGQGKETRNGDGWLTCCPVHGDQKPSLSVWDDDKGGVNVHCHANDCSFKDIKDRFVADGLLPEWQPEHKSQVPKTRPKKEPPVKEEKEPESEEVSLPWTKGSKKDLSHAKKYLASRAITLDPLPECIKWGNYKDRKTGETVNMIVFAASKPDDKQVFAVQRLFIDMDDHTKSGAKMLGNCIGRGVWFDRQGDVTEIAISEGVETTLSITQATGKNSVAALSTAGMKKLDIPDATNTIYICTDSDPVREKEAASMPGQKAAYILAKKFEASREGRTAFIVSPDDSCFTDDPAKLDFNDLLKEDPTGETIRTRFKRAIAFEDLEWKPPVKEEATKNPLKNDPAQIAAMFERFVFLASENKIIDTVGHDIKESMMIERAFILSQAGQFYRYKDPEGKEKVIPLTQHWLMSDHKKTASATKYQPGYPLFFENGDGRSYYNSFRFPHQSADPLPDLEERLQPWHKIMQTVFHEEVDYMEDWFSYSIQHPENRSGIMPICISKVGLGKSVIMSIMSRVVGHQNFSNAKILDVTGLGKSGTQWGDWIFNKKISCIEEIDPEGESGIAYKIVDALKDIITNETLSLNLKGGRNGTFYVFSNIIGFSNHQNCVKVPYGDRRLFIVDSTGQEKLKQSEYEKILAWMKEEGNIIAVYQYLLNREIGDEFNPGQAKMTDAKKCLQADGRSALQTAFDLVINQYPCDLLTAGELQRAVSQAMHHTEDGTGIAPDFNWNAEKQFQAIMKSCTTLVAGGNRIYVQRQNGAKTKTVIRALRNGQDWIGASNQELKEAMNIMIPQYWISEEEEFDLF